MNGADVLKEMIMKALEKCTDIELLDFIYKMIVSETQSQQNTTAIV